MSSKLKKVLSFCLIACFVIFAILWIKTHTSQYVFKDSPQLTNKSQKKFSSGSTQKTAGNQMNEGNPIDVEISQQVMDVCDMDSSGTNEEISDVQKKNLLASLHKIEVTLDRKAQNELKYNFIKIIGDNLEYIKTARSIFKDNQVSENVKHLLSGMLAKCRFYNPVCSDALLKMFLKENNSDIQGWLLQSLKELPKILDSDLKSEVVAKFQKIIEREEATYVQALTLSVYSNLLNEPVLRNSTINLLKHTNDEMVAEYAIIALKKLNDDSTNHELSDIMLNGLPESTAFISQMIDLASVYGANDSLFSTISLVAENIVMDTIAGENIFQNKQVLYSAVNFYELFRKDEASSVFLKILNNSTDDDIRRFSISKLKNFVDNDKTVVYEMIDVLKTDTETLDIKLSALGVLEKSKNPTVLQELEYLLSSKQCVELTKDIEKAIKLISNPKHQPIPPLLPSEIPLDKSR